jgi:hypothetical protein
MQGLCIKTNMSRELQEATKRRIQDHKSDQLNLKKTHKRDELQHHKEIMELKS